jgi:hypothetical protein
LAILPDHSVRWLSGRKHRFAKAAYSKRVSRVQIPPSPLFPPGGEDALDEETLRGEAAATRDFPVDLPDVVARLIATELLEVSSTTISR